MFYSSKMKELELDIKLIRANINDYPVIQNMARFYVYDLSRECGLISEDWAIPANGLYESFDFKQYFEDSTREAHVIKVNDELAGFVLLNKICALPKGDWNMGEFFILAKFQRKGIGQKAAHQIWNDHPGLWEVSVIPENISALAFWRKSISNYTFSKYKEKIKIVDFDLQQPKRIILSFNTIN